MSDRVYMSSPHMGGDEIKFIQEAFDTNWISPAGPHLANFEKDLGALLGVDHVAVLSSGTAAIHLALINLGIGAGDEVLCSTFTFAATANPIIYQKATPVFVDSETDTWNMDPELLRSAIEDRISKGIKPKALIVVHLYGMPAKMNEISSIAEEYEIPVIEDAAEALGSKYFDQPAGTFGVMSVLSFNGNKIITTSGGGALLSDNQHYIDHARFLATQARDDAPHYQHSHIGYNYRMSNICAAIGRGQMRVLAQRVEQRRANFTYYQERLSGIEGIEFLSEPEGFYSNRWLTCLLIDPDKAGTNREEVRTKLEEMNIESRPLWKPMHLQPVFDGFPFYVNGTSEVLFNHGLCLPSGSNLPKEDLDKIIDVISSLAC